MIEANLGIGSLSSEIIEAVFKNSSKNNRELMLIASKNQIDYDGGYVNNWTTSDYIKHIKKIKREYPLANVKICRDHCGPGFNGNYDLEDTYKTIKSDIKNGFDLIHIDFCHLATLDKLKQTKKAIKFCLSADSNIKFEIGTDENNGTIYNESDLRKLEKEIDYFKEFCNPEFYVVQTGSLIKEINQIGKFNQKFIYKVSALLHSKGIKLKEHNSDYLSKEEVRKRKGLVDAMNIAPQLGIVQTITTLETCLVYGIDFNYFLNKAYDGKRWEKWMHHNTKKNKFLCSVIAGHYHFAGDEYKRLINKLEERVDIKKRIIKKINGVINHYANC